MSTLSHVYIYTAITHGFYADNYAVYTLVGTLRAGGSRAVAYLSVSMATSYNQYYVNKGCYTSGDSALVSGHEMGAHSPL